MGNISIAKCDEYDAFKVKKSVKEAIEHLGGISVFVKPGDKVLLKVNLLIRKKPEKAATTHPSVVQAIGELVLEAGGIPIIGDSPGGYHFYKKEVLKAVYDTCGMTEAAEKSGAQLNFNTEVVDVPYPDGKIIKNIKTIAPLLEVDKVINIPKIKTHMMTVYSGAVKNMFGIIPGSYKAEYHLRFENTRDFANLLIDLCLFSKPTLTIMDAVIGMEGYGPTNGKPKKVGLIIAGVNPFELDVIAAGIIGLKPNQVPTIKASAERNLCSDDLNTIKVLGEVFSEVIINNFKKPTTQFSFNFYNLLLPKFIVKRINIFIKPKPKFNFSICKGCEMCAKSCPPKAIAMVNGRPHIDYNSCIRCFCCHELCNYNAVVIKRPWFLKLLLK
jgi:uncharacterized protein (DUF362 family)/ferredoxin-like protein FixX